MPDYKDDELKAVINHIFLPPKLSQADDEGLGNLAMCKLCADLARDYQRRLPKEQQVQWAPIPRMLDTIYLSTQFPGREQLLKSMKEMRCGDVLAFHVRAQNAAMVIRKFEEEAIYEVFEATPTTDAVLAASGKLICTYPGPAVKVPSETSSDPAFMEELASFLAHMDVDELESTINPEKGTHPRYISELLVGILRGWGSPTEVPRIRKRIADDIVGDEGDEPWRRSPLWRIICVVMQTTAQSFYKAFMIFLHARLSQLCCKRDFPSELLFCMRAKTSRRVFKLDSATPSFVLQIAEEAAMEVDFVLQARWEAIKQMQMRSPAAISTNDDITLATAMSLPNSRQYISDALQIDRVLELSSGFPTPHKHLPHHFEDLVTGELLNISQVGILDFEDMVVGQLESWADEHLDNVSAPATIYSCLQQYSASKNYYGPEDKSLMFLTALDLWVALDRIAMTQCPLLKEYSPEIPVTFLEPLLLRQTQDLTRAAAIVRYLQRRHTAVTIHTSIFSQSTINESFSVQYYSGSQLQKDTHTKIEREASRQREEKRAEFSTKLSSWNSIMAEATSIDHYHHDSYTPTNKDCRKCLLEQRAEKIDILVYEWPLPSDRLQAINVVFELQCPSIFAMWRSATYTLLHDFGRTREHCPKATVERHVLLAELASANGTDTRLTLNANRPPLQTRLRHNTLSSSRESDILLENSMQFNLYDKEDCTNITRAWRDLSTCCVWQLPESGPYSNLQTFVAGVEHSSNGVIAKQSTCSEELSLHEYIAFASLRSGGRLQWMNIARELRVRSLTFSREEVHSLIMQATWQVGPLLNNGKDYEWHYHQPDFVNVLTGELDSILSQIESNWMEGVTAKTAVLLTIRLLASVNNDASVCEKAYGVLRKARKITWKWIHELVEQLQVVNKDEDNSIKDLQFRVCGIAATCRATYDVDPAHFDNIVHSIEDVAVFIECAIVLHNNVSPNHDGLPDDLQILLRIDQRLAYRLEHFFTQRIESAPQGIDQAIHSVWPGYRPGNDGWHKTPESSWLVSSTTPSGASQRSQSVGLNLLDGELLIDGKPFGRLPASILTHPTYTRIFGTTTFDIVPADSPGMDFTTKTLISETWEVSFVLINGRDLVIRAKLQNTNQFLELIPHDKLYNDFPKSFIDDYVHWLSLSTGELEFRPLQSQWEPSPSNWHLQFSIQQPSVMVKAKSRRLIDIHSTKFAQIYQWLKPFERAEYINVTYDMQQIRIYLPRFRLTFLLTTEGALESQNFPGMVIDENQSSGTMFGLQHQLVLRQKDVVAQTLPCSRCVLIPQGDPIAKLEGHHVIVHIDTRSARRVFYHTYQINSDLGYLRDTGSLNSRLYKIYLHALCSNCLPDTLTRRTGTEEALHQLRSSGSFSFRSLAAQDMRILSLISSLTPCRKRVEAMQSIIWSSNIPCLSQHDSFYPAVQSILNHAKRLNMFIENKCDWTVEPCGLNLHLLQRAACRNTIFYPIGCATGANLRHAAADSANDVEYCGRDVSSSHDKAREQEVCQISRMVKSWPSKLPMQSNLLATIQSWGHLAGAVAILPTYDRVWLESDVSRRWLGLYNMCRQPASDIRRRKFQFTFNLAAMTYGSPAHSQTRHLVHTILAFATIEQFRNLDPPPYMDYDLSDGFCPDQKRLRDIITTTTRMISATPAAALSSNNNEHWLDFYHRKRKHYEQGCDECIQPMVAKIMEQWSPDSSVSLQSSQFAAWEPWIDIPCCIERVQALFQSHYRNRELRQYILQVEEILQANISDQLITSDIPVYPDIVISDAPFLNSARAINFGSPFNCVAPNIESIFPVLWQGPYSDSSFENEQNILKSDNLIRLYGLLAKFQQESQPLLHQVYGKGLNDSCDVLQNTGVPMEAPARTVSLDTLIRYRARCKKRIDTLFGAIRTGLSLFNRYERLICDAGLGPRHTPQSILGYLAHDGVKQLSREWRTIISAYAELFIAYQRSQRLIRYTLCSSPEEFTKELDNAYFNEHDAHEYPDWLLIQIDGDFLARHIQTRVAHEMISPESGSNTVLQLNMGEGKSSVIVPFVTVALADGQNLVRVVVLKSLVGQMFQTLSERLCGLANRRIFYLPFSRNVNLNSDQVEHIRDLYQQCFDEGGILVAQPEHLLSFKLMGVNRALASRDDSSNSGSISRQLRECQCWLDANSRDILDESDEILHVRNQVIYTMGEQKPVEDHPRRWTTIQQVLTLVKEETEVLYDQYLKAEMTFDFETGTTGTFPTIRILSDRVAEAVVSSVVHGVLKGKLFNFPRFAFLPKHIHDVVLRFLTLVDIEPQDLNSIKGYFSDTDNWKGLLLLRGLLSQGILVYALKERRWRVDYGLDLGRSLLAVPYRAKDTPSVRAEFGHPDVAIVLTCLSYYYGGLTTPQLRQCFNMLFKLDNPTLEYEQWIRGDIEIPEVLQELRGVNMSDQRQFDQTIVPLFRRRHAVIDFFLSSIVFPKAAKEFPMKIGTSGWDIAESKTYATTGFSGTNDNRYILPTSISQEDPLQQSSTNAFVLNTLLAPENESYMCIPHDSMSVANFLELLNGQVPEIRVLLDVGAQMLEKNNQELAQCWLHAKSDAAAAIFFNESDKLCVLTQDGMVQSLRSSPFNQQLGKCVIYLDDAHTRGTDLNLPRDFRAAVTLGPKVTKDRLLQGCMRMRQLGKGQSVMFFAPEEIDIRIRDERPQEIDHSTNVSVLDVLRWTMLETCADIQRHIPQWIKQGVDYNKRRIADQDFSDDGYNIDLLRSAWLLPESRSLEEMYQTTSVDSSALQLASTQIPALADRLNVILGDAVLSSHGMQEEQEREVAHEMEVERQVARPPVKKPLKHELVEHVRDFVRTGLIPVESKSAGTILPLLQPLSSSLGATRVLRQPWSPALLATRDFAQTVDGLAWDQLSDYMRPPIWIVSSTQNGDLILVVMSPYEVNEILPEIRISTVVHLHQYAPRVTHSMKSFEDLRFYCVPALPEWQPLPPASVQMQLNLWAGQLNLKSFEAYKQLCTFLGLVHSANNAKKIEVQTDGFVRPKHRSGLLLRTCPFAESPLSVLKELVGLRRKGMSYVSTDIGKILNGRLLSQADFEDMDEEDD